MIRPPPSSTLFPYATLYRSSGATNTGIFAVANNNFNIGTAGTSRLQIDQLGNVSIGTTIQLSTRHSCYVTIVSSTPACPLNVATSSSVLQRADVSHTNRSVH